MSSVQRVSSRTGPCPKTHAIPAAKRRAVERVARVLDPVGPKSRFVSARGDLNASSPRGRAFLPRALAKSIIPAMEILKIVVLAVGGCLVGLFLAFLQSTHLPPHALLGFSRAVLVAVVQAAFLGLKNDPRKHFSRNRWQYILWFSAFALLSVVQIVLVELKHNPREFERLENWFLQQWRYPGVFALCLTAVVVSVGRLASFWKRHAQRSYGVCEV